MGPLRIILLIAALLAIASCTSEPLNHSSAIDMDEWCAYNGDMPWSGCWQEVRQFDCETGDEFEAAEAIGELRLKPDGRYSITWHHFEIYTDYAGTHNINQAEGTIAFNHDNASGFDWDVTIHSGKMETWN